MMLLPEAREALAQWFVASGQPPDEARCWPSRKGDCRPCVPDAIGRQLHRLLTRAGLWHRGLGVTHRLRRSFATVYLQANPADLEGLRRLMRHEKITTTAMYCYREPADLAQRLAKMQL
jgi:site-specific recombinase XerC